MSKLRVLHFIWSANFGGIEKMAIELARAQNSSGDIEANVLVGCTKGEFFDTLKEYKIPYLFGNLNSGYDLRINKVLNMQSEMKKFDIIHFHTFNLAAMLAAKLSGKKIIYTIHGNFNYGKKIGLTDKINNHLKKYFLNNHITFITFNSKWCKEESIKRFGLKNVKSKVIYNGLPPLQESAAESDEYIELQNKLKNKFVVGTVSRFNQSKRIDRLIEAYSLFSKGKVDTLLLLVGGGLQRTQLEIQVHKNKLEGSTIFTGYQSNPLAFVKLMDVCVFPFQHEAFGLVVVEALSLGKPILIFKDAGGMKEILSKNFTRDIIHTVEELVERMNFYYFNKNQTSNDTDLRKQVAAGFSIEKMHLEFMSCYKTGK